jgi:glycine/D-amino acid oxidase-like deaminating enzyme
MNETRADVVIIGGGIIGCATAYYLAKRNVDVVLVEKGAIGDEQSSRNWGFVRQQRRDPAEMPFMVESNRIWQGLEDELDADIEWVQDGILAVADDEATMERLRSWVPVSEEFGVETRILSRAELLQIAPSMTGQHIGGIYTPSDGHAEPRKATDAFAAAAGRHGARLLTYHAAEGIEVTGGRVSAVITDRNTIQTPVVVNAAGAWAMKIARMVDLSLPQLIVRSTVAQTTPMKRITNAGVWAPGVSFRQKRNGTLYVARGGQSDYDITLDSFRHMRQFLPNFRQNRQLFRLHAGSALWNDIRGLIPWTEEHRHPFTTSVGIDPQPNVKTARNTLKQLIELIPEASDLRLQRTWAGLIDTTPDAIPVLGRVDEVPGFIFATGFSGHGFGIGPIAGKLMAELITDGETSIDTSAMAFSRFAEGKLAKPKSVA